MSDCKKNKMTGKLEAPRRNNYFYGKLLDEKSLIMEQRYFNKKRWMMNRLGLGSGVMCGLNITPQGQLICISAGVAIDGLGREIVVPNAILIDPRQLTDDAGRPTTDKLKGDGQVFLTLCYCECPADYVPVLVTDCDSTNQTKPSTITEGYCLIIKQCTENLPPALPPVTDPAICAALSEVDAETKRKKICEVLSKRPCPAPGECVVLAKVILNTDKVEVELCGTRPLIYSNPELFEMLMCLSTGDGTGTPGPMGPAGLGIDYVVREDRLCTEDPTVRIEGVSPNRTLYLGIPPGCDGSQGPPGKGLDDTLTKIVKVNWPHDGQMTWKQFLKNGLRIDFSDEVRTKPDHDQGWFLVSFELSGGKRAPPLSNAPPALSMLYLMLGFIWPAGTTLVYRCNIEQGSITGLPPASSSTGLYAQWELSVTTLPLYLAMFNLFFKDVRILIRVVAKCDFLIDKNDKCVDGNHLGGSLRSNKETGDGVGGGEFESWFELVEPNSIIMPGISPAGSMTHMLSNTAMKSEINALEKILPGIAGLTAFFNKGGQ